MGLIVRFFTLVFISGLLTSCGGGGGGGLTDAADTRTEQISYETVPANGSSNVGLSPMIEIRFSEAMNPTTINPYSVRLSTAIPATVSNQTMITNLTASNDNRRFYFSPEQPLKPGTRYWITLSDMIKSQSGATLTGQISFTTGFLKAPQVSMVAPGNASADVNQLPVITLQFSEQVQQVTTDTVSLHEGSSNGPLVTLSNITTTENLYYMLPATKLKARTTYYVAVSSKITNQDLEPVQPTVFSFTTGTSTAPIANMTTPSNNAYNVSKSPIIKVQFNQPVFGLDKNAVNLYVYKLNGATIPIKSISQASNNTYTFTLATDLAPRTSYYLVLENTITSVAQLQPLAKTIFTFTTGDLVAPTVALVSPNNRENGVALNLQLQLLFSDDIINFTLDAIELRENSPTGNKITPLSFEQNLANPREYLVTLPQLANSTLYYLSLNNTITDKYSNPLAKNQFSFTTGDFIAPQVSVTQPSNVAKLPLYPKIEIEFTERVKNVIPQNVKLRKDNAQDGQECSVKIEPSSESATKYLISLVESSAPLAINTPYYLVLSNKITDNSGNPLQTKSFAFKTQTMTWTQVRSNIGSGDLIQLVASPKGTMYIAYKDFGNLSSNRVFATVKQFDKTTNSWVTVGTPGFTNAEPVDFQLAVSPVDEAPYLVFRDSEALNYGQTVFAFKNGIWQLVGGNRAMFGYAGINPSLVINRLGGVFVIYDPFYLTPSSTRLYTFNNTAWTPLGEELKTHNPHLAANPATGTIFMAYGDGSTINPYGQVRVRKLVSNKWFNPSINEATHSNSVKFDIAVARDDTPYLATVEDNGKIIVNKINKATNYWELVGNLQAPLDPNKVANAIAIAVDGNGIPYLAYRDAYTYQALVNSNIVVMRYVAGSWQQVGSNIITNAKANEIALSIDPSGVPYVAYSDSTGYMNVVRLD